MWRLGGKESDFRLPEQAQFNFQHHARIHGQNDTHTIISFLDNSKGEDDDDRIPPRPYSAGLILALNTVSMEGTVVAEYAHPYHDYTRKRGSAHVLPNGNVFMVWADDILISEHAPNGTVLMEANILPHLDSYRSYKFEWVGRPLDPPNVYSAAFFAGANVSTMVYVSWNGATEVKRWALHESTGKDESGSLLDTVNKKGFETVMQYDGCVLQTQQLAKGMH